MSAIPCWKLNGSVDLQNVMDWMRQGEQWIQTIQTNHAVITLKDVISADSSVLALLLAWKRYGKSLHKEIIFQDVPGFVIELSHVMGVEELLFQWK